MPSPYWIKLYHEILDDPIMGKMDDHLWRRTIELFLIAGKEKTGGELPDIKEIAWTLHTDERDIEVTLQELESGEIVHQDENGIWFVTNFAERQRKMTTAERMAAYRNRKRFQGGNDPGTKRYKNRNDVETKRSKESYEPVTKRNRNSNESVTKRNATRNTSRDMTSYEDVTKRNNSRNKDRITEDSARSDGDVTKRNRNSNETVTKTNIKSNIPRNDSLRGRYATRYENVLDIDIDIEKEEEKDKEKENEKKGEENHPPPHAEPEKVLPSRDASLNHHQSRDTYLEAESEKILHDQIHTFHEFDTSSPTTSQSTSKAQVMMTVNPSPVSYFCKSFNCKNLNRAQNKALLTLEAQHGPELLFKVIDWAAEKDIPIDRAISAIKSAIKYWQEKPKIHSPTKIGDILTDPSSIFEQIRQEYSNGDP